MSPRKGQTPGQPKIGPGEVDAMTIAARMAAVPLCGQTDASLTPRRQKACTRVAGHADGGSSGHGGQYHPSTDHVHAPAPKFVAVQVWTAPGDRQDEEEAS